MRIAAIFLALLMSLAQSYADEKYKSYSSDIVLAVENNNFYREKVLCSYISPCRAVFDNRFYLTIRTTKHQYIFSLYSANPGARQETCCAFSNGNLSIEVPITANPIELDLFRTDINTFHFGTLYVKIYK